MIDTYTAQIIVSFTCQSFTDGNESSDDSDIVPATFATGRGKRSTFSVQQIEEIMNIFNSEITGNAKINAEIVGMKIKGNKLLKKCDPIKLCSNIRYHRLKARAA